MDTKRVFTAIEISESARVSAAHRIGILRGEFGGRAARWVRVENLHITLHFFGDLTMEGIEDLKKSVIASAANCPAFTAFLIGPGVFPMKKPAKVLWIGAAPEKEFKELKKRLDDDLIRSGIDPGKRRYHPHLTIARVKTPGTAGSLSARHLAAEFEPVSFSVDRIAVFESVLKPTGSEYHKLFEVNLSGSAV